MLNDGAVQTVLGLLPAGELGRTQVHEHLLLDIYPSRWSFEHILDDEDVAVEELKRFADTGGRTIVELTLRGAGRDPLGLQRISRATGVNVVMGTGFLWGPRSSEAGAFLLSQSIDELAAAMISDLLDGVDGSAVRAGVIGEIGSGSERRSGGRNAISQAEERLLRAAARAHKATGAPIYTDTFHGELALEQIALLQSEGVSPSRVVIGHLGDRREVDYYERIAQTGANLGFDHVGMLNCAPDQWRAQTIRELVARGYVAQIVLSMDVHRRSYWRCLGGLGYDYLLAVFVPLLLQSGLDQAAVETMLVANPGRLLPFAG